MIKRSLLGIAQRTARIHGGCCQYDPGIAVRSVKVPLQFGERECILVYSGKRPESVCDCVQTGTVVGVAFVSGNSHD